MTYTAYAHTVNHMGTEHFDPDKLYNAKIRYNHGGEDCHVKELEGGRIECTFTSPVRAVTPGQALVIYDGDIVIVESCGEIPVGKVGIFLYNGESYIKKFGGDRLRSVNPAYKDIVFKENDDIRCLGLVLGTISKE